VGSQHDFLSALPLAGYQVSQGVNPNVISIGLDLSADYVSNFRFVAGWAGDLDEFFDQGFHKVSCNVIRPA